MLTAINLAFKSWVISLMTLFICLYLILAWENIDQLDTFCPADRV